MEKIKELLLKYREIISYVIFGVMTTLVNMGVYAVMVRLFKVDLSTVDTTENAFYTILHSPGGKSLTMLFIANVIAWTAGVIFAFVTNKLWVFESKSWKPGVALKEFGSFVGARLATGALEWFGIPALVLAGMTQSFIGIEGFWAKAVVSVAVVILNYVFSKFIVFRKKHKSDNT